MFDLAEFFSIFDTKLECLIKRLSFFVVRKSSSSSEGLGRATPLPAPGLLRCACFFTDRTGACTLRNSEMAARQRITGREGQLTILIFEVRQLRLAFRDFQTLNGPKKKSLKTRPQNLSRLPTAFLRLRFRYLTSPQHVSSICLFGHFPFRTGPGTILCSPTWTLRRYCLLSPSGEFNKLDLHRFNVILWDPDIRSPARLPVLCSPWGEPRSTLTTR